MKVCSKCRVEKDESEFNKQKSKKDGLHIWCKLCTKEHAKNYRINNKDRVKEIKRNYYINNTQECKDRSKRYILNNSEKVSERSKRYRLNNLEHEKERKKNYRIHNRDKSKENDRSHVLNLADCYVRYLISQGHFSQTIVPQDLVDFHREVIRAKRLLKELQK